MVHAAAKEADVEVETVLLDVTDAERCEKVLAGRTLYGLVNNAGYSLTGAVEDVGDDDARRLFETMVHAPMRLARLALPAMRAKGEGRIVNVSSIAGRASAPFVGHYTGAKHALEALSDALRMEVAGDGVQVVLVEPGGFKTGIWTEMENDIERHAGAGSRYTDAYRRSLQGQRMLEVIMGEPAACARVIGRAMTTRMPAQPLPGRPRCTSAGGRRPAHADLRQGPTHPLRTGDLEP